MSRAVYNVLRNDNFKKVFIVSDMIFDFLNFPFGPLENTDPPTSDDVEEPEMKNESISESQEAALKTLYAICALPEFAVAYPLESDLVRWCMRHVMGRGKPTDHVLEIQSQLLVAAACIILANLMISEESAKKLVSNYGAHSGLIELIGTCQTQEILVPALQVMDRLTLTRSIRPTLIADGLLDVLSRFFKSGTQQQVQFSAVIIARRLITSAPQVLDHSWVRACGNTDGASETDSDSGLSKLLNVFQESRDGSTKREVGRFMIEVCRTLWSSVPGRPEAAEEAFMLTIGEHGHAFAAAITFVALHGGGEGAQGEGWFGLAMMTVWAHGRTLVAEALEDDAFSNEMQKVSDSKGGPAYQNLRLLLVQMRLEPVRIKYQT